MRKKDATGDCIAARDREFLEVVKEELNLNERLSLTELLKRAILHRASRFWVSEERAYEVVLLINKGVFVESSPCKRRMYREIHRRVTERQKKINESLKASVFAVVNGEAPEFYISMRTARRIAAVLRIAVSA